MLIKNTSDAYGLITKIIHWTMALMILWLLSVGFFMGEIPMGEAKLWVYALHKSFGLLVLWLIFLRVAWHILSRKPKSLDTHAPWEKFLAHAAHVFLYVAMFAMPFSGWVMSSAGDFTVQFFGIQMPDIVAKNETLFKNAREVHETLAIISIVVIGLHMVGAFKHHFIDRDKTLARMSRKDLGFGGGAVLVVIAGLLMLPPVYFVANDILQESKELQAENTALPDGVENSAVVENIVEEGAWVIDLEKSKIAFEATQYGQSFEGRFEKFGGVIVFDPAALDTSKVEITIETASIKTGAADRDGQALGTDWFDVQNNPQARFVSQSFESVGENQYVAHGTLSIRGASLPLDLPFSLDIEEKEDEKSEAKMKAEITLNRLDFGIGQGEWKSTDAIGNAVKVKIEIDATR